MSTASLASQFVRPLLYGQEGHLPAGLQRQLMRLGAQFRLYGDPGLPNQIHLCPTDRCNLTCRQCDIWRIDPAPELTTEEWKRVLNECAALCPGASLNFAGGEPFVRTDLVELIEHGVKLGFTVSANSNGLLVDDELAKRLYDAGLDILYLSLDGGTPQSHDTIRNRPGAFNKVMRAFDALDRVGRPRVVIAAILHRLSVPEAPQMLNLAKERGYQIVFQPLYQTFAEPYDPTWYQRSPWMPDDFVMLDEVLDTLILEKRNDGPICNEARQLEAFKGYFRAPTLPNGLGCKAGFKDIALDPYGNFLVCYHLRPVGNVRERHIESLWWGKQTAERRQEVVDCPRTCNLQNCNFNRKGGG